LFTERNKTINYLLSMLTELAEVSTIQFGCDEMIDASIAAGSPCLTRRTWLIICQTDLH